MPVPVEAEAACILEMVVPVEAEAAPACMPVPVEEAAAAEAAAEAAVAEAEAEAAAAAAEEEEEEEEEEAADDEASADGSALGSSSLAALGKRRPSRRPLVTAELGAGVGAIEGVVMAPGTAPVASRSQWPSSAVPSAYAMEGDSTTATRNGDPRMGLPAKVTASISSCSPFLPNGVYLMP